MNTGFWFTEVPWRPLGDRVVSSSHPVYVTAEIGDDHSGELVNMLARIDHAAYAGCDAVRLENRQRMELDADAYAAIDRHARTRGIAWFASSVDMASVDLLEQFDVAAHMVAPGSLTDDELLRRLRATGRTVLVPTGRSTMRQIHHAVEVLGGHHVVLCHAGGSHPAAIGELNLRMLRTLQEEFPCIPVGYSGHENGLQPALAAVAMGAVFVEHRLTADRAMRRLVRDIRALSEMLGDGVERVYDEERDRELAHGGVFAPNPAA